MTVEDLVPPLPEQDKVKLILPAAEIVTVSDPEVPFVPDQAPEAEHEVAFEDDHVSVELEPTDTEVGLAEKLKLGAGDVGVVGVDPPPPPPPPHEAKIKVRVVKNNVFLKDIPKC